MQKFDPEDRLELVPGIGGTNTRMAVAHGRDVFVDSISRYSSAEAPCI